MKVILICGKASSGKNQLADYIEKYLNRDSNGNFVSKTLVRGNAQSVKEIAYRQYNWDGVKDRKGRQLLLDITNERYNYDNNYWEKETFLQAIMHQETNRNCEYLIIPDWRYAQTKTYFEKVADEVITIRITRPNLEEGTHSDHSSENDFKNFEVDYEVINDKDLLNLEGVARRICLKM